VNLEAEMRQPTKHACRETVGARSGARHGGRL
jgi:hypothetical protein